MTGTVCIALTAVRSVLTPVPRPQRRMVPSTGNFFTPLRLVDAFQEYDEFFALSRRKYVPPNFAEIRHILNIAQVCVLSTRQPAYVSCTL